MFAVIETGGKQYKVQYGDVIYVEKLAANEDETVTFPVVAICGEDGKSAPRMLRALPLQARS